MCSLINLSWLNKPGQSSLPLLLCLPNFVEVFIALILIFWRLRNLIKTLTFGRGYFGENLYFIKNLVGEPRMGQHATFGILTGCHATQPSSISLLFPLMSSHSWCLDSLLSIVMSFNGTPLRLNGSSCLSMWKEFFQFYLLVVPTRDFLAWLPHWDGIYSVKRGYFFAKTLQDLPELSESTCLYLVALILFSGSISGHV